MRFSVFATALIAAALPAVASAATFTPADDARIVGLSSPAFAPDGRRVVLVRTIQDTKADKSHTSLIAVDVAGGALRELTHGREGIAQPAFSPDGRQLAFLAYDAKRKRQIDVVPAAGGPPRALTRAAEGVQQFAWRPDGRALAYVTADPPPKRIAEHRDFFEITDDDYLTRANDPPSHLWLVNADGRAAHRLTAGSWSAATTYPPSPPASPLSWSPDGTRLLFTRVPNTHDGDAYLSEIALLDVARGSVRPLTGRGRFEGFATFSPDGRRIAYLANRADDPNDENDVFLTEPAGGRGSAVSTKLDRNVYRALWTDDRTLLVGGNDGLHQAMWLLHDDGSAQRVDTGAAEPNLGYWLQAAVAKNGALAYVGSTATRPSELWYQPNPTTAPRRLTHLNDAVAGLQLGKTEPVSWTGPDGWAQNGTLTYPPDYAPGKQYPLVLLVHGGPIGASTLSFGSLEQGLAARGLLVFQPNYRGSDNGGNAYQRAIYMDAGDGPGRDVMAGLAAVEQLGVVDQSRIAVSGWSYGGYMTSWLMTHYHPWKAALSGAAVDDWVDMYDLGDGNVQTGFGFRGSPHVGDNLADYRAQSPITYALQVTCPVLIVSDIGDARVPVTQSFRMYRTLKDNGKPVRFVGIPVDGHNPGDIVRRIAREQLWIDWAVDALR